MLVGFRKDRGTAIISTQTVRKLWAMRAYDVVILFEAPDDETMSAFTLKIGALGNVKSQTLRAFGEDEMGRILSKMK